MARVVFDGVTKRFGDVTALREFSLEIEDGEFVVLVGPSGSGKTTALRLVAGLEALSSGEIHVGDRVVNRLAPRDRDIAMVFQDYALYPQMTVRQNLAFALKTRKTHRDEIERRVIGVTTGGDQQFTVLAAAETPVRAGKQVRFGLEPGRLHLFDVTTQQALDIV